MKNTGFFTKTAGKAFKSDRMICREANGYNYVCNGYVIFKMTMEEYDATIRPVVKCDPGDWWIDKSGKRELRPDEMNLAKLLQDAVDSAKDTKSATIAPMLFKLDKVNAAGMMDQKSGKTAFFNSLFVDAFAADTEFHITGTTSPAVAVMGGEAIGLIMPLRASQKMIRAVESYCADEAQDAKPANGKACFDDGKKDKTIKAMKEAIENLAADNSRLAKELESYKAKVQELMAEQNAQQDEPQQEQEKEPEQPSAESESPIDKFNNFPGTIATMKGANTEHPVIWITGDTKPHAKALKELGAKWSHKKSAWYYKVA